VLKDFDAYNFLDGKPPTPSTPACGATPSLNANYGLFKVTDGVYQLRGFDIANMTMIEGKNRLDRGGPADRARNLQRCLAFARQHLGNKPVSAVVLTHAHATTLVACWAWSHPRKWPSARSPCRPDWLHGRSHQRKHHGGHRHGAPLAYQFGRDLPRNAKGNVDTGLGKDVAYGTIGIIAAHLLITQPTRRAGLTACNFVFHNVPGAEAPAEMTFSIPAKKAVRRRRKHEPAPCTTCCPCAAPRCATRCAGPTTWTRRWSRCKGRRDLHRLPQLAGLGQCQHPEAHHHAPRCVQVHPRPDRAPDQRGQHPQARLPTW
jgi:hypothetical protein